MGACDILASPTGYQRKQQVKKSYWPIANEATMKGKHPSQLPRVDSKGHSEMKSKSTWTTEISSAKDADSSSPSTKDILQAQTLAQHHRISPLPRNK